MTPEKFVNWKFVLFLLIVPILVAGVAFVIAYIDGEVRYTPDYFSSEYIDRYEVLDPFLTDLEKSMKNGDEALMQALQGTRRKPKNIDPNPNIQYSFLLDRKGDYYNHIFWDVKTYNRYVQHIKLVDGRYVVVPESLYYYVDSGTWPPVFAPPALYWWSFTIIISAGVWLYRVLAVVRQQIFGGSK
jgi:hypothetical protein